MSDQLHNLNCSMLKPSDDIVSLGCNGELRPKPDFYANSDFSVQKLGNLENPNTVLPTAILTPTFPEP
jgi:hypothetical protein